ncbi:MAG: 50S ribosomal protein L10 [Flavobacteriales bacterium]|nr:50S ribosomal protein L10 [Flavobacteriales bacterium]
MNKLEKNEFIDSLAVKLADAKTFYLTDIAALDAEASSKLRRLCFNKQVSMQVVKNTLLKKAMERVEDKNYEELFGTLKGNTSIMFTDVANAPAKLIKEFRKKNDKPLLKGAFVEESIYLGEENLDTLANLKSKEELIGDIIMLLQSPAKNVISGLQSGGNTLSGLVKTLSER